MRCCSFQEDEAGDKTGNFMWVLTAKEIRNKQRKRTDFMQNGAYIAQVGDPSSKVPRSSGDHEKIFGCRRGWNRRKVVYTEEFVSEKVYRGYEDLDG